MAQVPGPMIRSDAICDASIAVMRAKAGRPTKGLLFIGRHRADRTAHIDQVCKTLDAEGVYITRITIS